MALDAVLSANQKLNAGLSNEKIAILVAKVYPMVTAGNIDDAGALADVIEAMIGVANRLEALTG